MREKFAMAAMQTMLQIKGDGTFQIARNHEGVCDDVAQASIMMADTMLKHLDNGKD